MSPLGIRGCTRRCGHISLVDSPRWVPNCALVTLVVRLDGSCLNGGNISPNGRGNEFSTSRCRPWGFGAAPDVPAIFHWLIHPAGSQTAHWWHLAGDETDHVSVAAIYRQMVAGVNFQPAGVAAGNLVLFQWLIYPGGSQTAHW